MRVYVTEGGQESLLGKEDVEKLGILKLKLDGDAPDGDDMNRLRIVVPEVLRCITPEILEE